MLTVSRKLPVSVAFVLILGLVSWVAPAQASPMAGLTKSDTAQETSEIEQQVQKAVPDPLAKGNGASVPFEKNSKSGTISAEDTGNLVLPTSGDGSLELGGISLGLPSEAQTQNGVVSDSGLAIYNGRNRDETSIAIQATTSSVAVQTVIPSSDAPHEYSYPIKGAVPVVQKDGSVLLKNEFAQVLPDREEHANTSIVGKVGAPWAVDANGKSVKTHYVVRGKTLVQIIDNDPKSVYPVVADPKISLFWWGSRWKLSKSETKTLSKGSTPAKYAATLCAFAGKANVIAGVACAVAGVAIFDKLDTVKSAASRGRCVWIDSVWTTGPVLWRVRSEKC